MLHTYITYCEHIQIFMRIEYRPSPIHLWLLPDCIVGITSGFCNIPRIYNNDKAEIRGMHEQYHT